MQQLFQIVRQFTTERNVYLFIFFVALKIFLNAESGLSRTLLMQILSSLWSIQKWARNQKSIRLYSSSLLIAYDARRLRNTLQISKKNSNRFVVFAICFTFFLLKNLVFNFKNVFFLFLQFIELEW